MAKIKNNPEDFPPVDPSFVEEGAECFGTAVIGQKGQIVIPAQARRKLGLKTGDQVFVFGKANELLTLIKSENVVEIVTRFNQKLDELNEKAKR